MFVYPPYKRRAPKYREGSYNNKKNMYTVRSEVSRNDTYWSNIYKKIDETYKLRNKVLPTETFIYRGTLQKNPYNFKSNRKSPLIYFGLDFVISTWISLETHHKFQKDNRIKNKIHTYYLHVYKTKTPIDYTYIPNDKGTVMDFDKDSALKYPCVHPQTILHGDNDYLLQYSELGTELTFPRNDDNNMRDIIEHVCTYVVDISLLQSHVNTFISEWNPVHSLKKI